jgi:hypothetical protein
MFSILLRGNRLPFPHGENPPSSPGFLVLNVVFTEVYIKPILSFRSPGFIQIKDIIVFPFHPFEGKDGIARVFGVVLLQLYKSGRF